MESTAFFEKKINLTPGEFNEVKNSSIDSLLETKAKQLIENKCSEQGFVLPGTVKLLSRSMGYFEAARFTGDAVYYLKLEGRVIYPADGVRVVGEVIRKNKMGLYVDYRKAIRIQVPRDLHIGSEEYEEVEIGDDVEVELKRSKFQINDPYILASAMFVAKKSKNIGSGEIITGGEYSNNSNSNNENEEDEDMNDKNEENENENGENENENEDDENEDEENENEEEDDDEDEEDDSEDESEDEDEDN